MFKLTTQSGKLAVEVEKVCVRPLCYYHSQIMMFYLPMGLHSFLMVTYQGICLEISGEQSRCFKHAIRAGHDRHVGLRRGAHL